VVVLLVDHDELVHRQLGRVPHHGAPRTLHRERRGSLQTNEDQVRNGRRWRHSSLLPRVELLDLPADVDQHDPGETQRLREEQRGRGEASPDDQEPNVRLPDGVVPDRVRNRDQVRLETSRKLVGQQGVRHRHAHRLPLPQRHQHRHLEAARGLETDRIEGQVVEKDEGRALVSFDQVLREELVGAGVGQRGWSVSGARNWSERGVCFGDSRVPVERAERLG
jgi:hypothetical protein